MKTILNMNLRRLYQQYRLNSFSPSCKFYEADDCKIYKTSICMIVCNNYCLVEVIIILRRSIINIIHALASVFASIKIYNNNLLF